MGCGYDFACKDCKESYYLGYGSYSTWILPKSEEEWNLTAYQSSNGNDPKKLQKNQFSIELVKKHSGHDFTYINWDCCYESKGSLWVDLYFEQTISIEDYSDYKRIDLEEENNKKEK